ncbi:hypothetical protein DFH28DRAFT_961777 [Melampsora americana]|nr:hypothetical protein DFH28DRAFT_961777 [Melampsora americana]
MQRTFLCFASASRRLPADGFSLNYFVLGAQVRSMYRKIIRETRGLGSSQIRIETIDWIRHDFDRHLQTTDEVKLKDLITQAQRQLRQLSNQNILNGGQFEKLRGGRV